MQSAQWVATARVLRRSGFGTTGAAVDAALASGDINAYVDALLSDPFDDDAGVRATPIPEFSAVITPKDAPDTTREKLNRRHSKQAKELATWWIRRMVAVDYPVREKLTFVWHNHFATSASPVRSAQLMARQNQALRDHCLGGFRDLSMAMLTDGAMLKWLNGNSNTAKSPNENLAREFLELFALGHGNGYSEDDVRDGARALSGWVVGKDGSVEFSAKRHDSKPKTVLGVTGDLDAESFCDIVLDQPNSSRFVAGRLWQQLASDTPPKPQTLDRLVNAYGDARDLKALTAAILTSPEFLRGRATIVTPPVDWLIGILRALRVETTDSGLFTDIDNLLHALGQRPFYPPNVGGWPKGRVWLSTATAQIRIRAARLATRHGDTSPVSDAPIGERVDAVAYFLGIGEWSDSSAKILQSYRKDPQALVIAAANTPEYLTT
jgi:uncharacterized protein (DUF1800 family)